MKEYKIGEIADYNGIKLKCVKSDVKSDCKKCFFSSYDSTFCNKILCSEYMRSDYLDVHFEGILEDEMKQVVITKSTIKKLEGLMGETTWGGKVKVLSVENHIDDIFSILLGFNPHETVNIASSDINRILYQLNNFYGFNIKLVKELKPIRTAKELRCFLTSKYNGNINIKIGEIDFESYGYKLEVE